MMGLCDDAKFTALKAEEYYIRNKTPDPVAKALKIINSSGVGCDRLKKAITPKTYKFTETIALAVVSSSDRFVSRNNLLSEEELEKIEKDGLIAGFWSTQVRARLYNINNESVAQIYIPKAGVVIPQKVVIEIERSVGRRMARKDSRFADVSREPAGTLVTSKRKKVHLFKRGSKS